MKEAIVLLSGGIDSATCAYLIRGRYAMRALTVEYHGITPGEVKASGRLASAAGAVEHRRVKLPDMKEAADMGARFPGLPATYIPARNAVFYSLAGAYAEEVGADLIIGGHNRDDRRIFPDVGPGFLSAMQAALRKGSPILSSKGTRLAAPLGKMTKVQVIREANRLGVPLELTWSCHRDEAWHCWHCAGCLARGKAFRAARVRDPLREG